MTEEEKRALALHIMEQEAARFQSHTHALNDQNQQRLNASLQGTAKQRQVFTNLARNGITWNELREAYHTAFKVGHDAMLTFKLSFSMLAQPSLSTKSSALERSKPPPSSIK